MNYLLRGIGVVAAVGALSLLAFSVPPGGEARGDDGDDVMPRVTHKAWQQECSSCHLAFPPSMLPRASWQKMMTGLDQHFGEDASLDPATEADILKFLEANAADSSDTKMGRRVMRRDKNTAPLRITESHWFVRKHDEVPRATWSRKSIGSPANCAACHRQADQGNYEEDAVRIPK